MKATTNKISKNGKSTPSDSLPDTYICIDEEEAVPVFDYLNGADDDVDRELVAAHLELCFHCQEVVAALITLDPKVRERLARLVRVRARTPVLI